MAIVTISRIAIITISRIAIITINRIAIITINRIAINRAAHDAPPSPDPEVADRLLLILGVIGSSCFFLSQRVGVGPTVHEPL